MIQAKKTTKTIRSKKAVVEKPVAKKERYFEAVGRRKTSTARIRITPTSKSSFVINDRDINAYFPTDELRFIVKEAILKGKIADKFKITVLVNGGGISSQAGAVRHALSRALIIFEKDLRRVLKPLGFLKRDPRAKERRKPGLKKARKAAQWSKR